MSDTNTGGPAFPCEWDYINSSREAANGMTLRDYFAAKAMQSIYQKNVDWEYNGSLPMDEESMRTIYVVAKDAYAVADAMIQARSAK